MANKRTYINADEELIIQGQLTIEGNVTQKQYVNTLTFTENQFEGDVLVVNSDGVNANNAPTSGQLTLRSGTTDSTMVFSQAVGRNVFNKDLQAPTLFGNITLAVARNFSITGSEGTASAQSFDGTGDVALPFVLSTTTVTAGSFGDAATIPNFTVDTKGRLTAAGETSVNITASQISNFQSAVRGEVSATDAGGDGSFAYDSGTGVFTYTGPSASEVRAHFSAGAGLTYDSGTGEYRITNTAVSAGDYGSASAVPTFTVNSKGMLTAAANVNISIPSSQITDLESTVEGFFSAVDAGGDGSFSYANGVYTYTGPSLAEVQSRIDNSAANVQQHISVTDAGGDGSLSYGSGVITYTGPSATEVRAHFSGGDGIDLSGGVIDVDNTVVRTSGNQSIAGDKTFTGTVDLSGATVPGFTVAGELQVTGNVNSLNYVDLQVQNSEIILNSNVATATDAQIKVERGSTGSDTYLKWEEGSDRWQFSNDGSTDNNMLLFSDFSAVDAGGDGSFSYANGVYTYTGPSAAEVRAHFSAGTGLSVSSGEFSISNTAVSAGTYGTSNDVAQIAINAQGQITSATDVAIDHDALQNFVADEHVAHSGVTLTAGDGISGGGDISASRSFAVDSTVVRTTGDQSLSGAKTFTGELITPSSASTANGAIYYDNSTNEAFIYVGGQAKKITPAVDAGDVEDVGAGEVNVYAGTRVSGNVTYHGIKSISSGTYTSVSEAANVITLDGDISAIRGAFSVSGDLSYNSGTGQFSFTQRSDSQVRGLISGTGLISYNNSTGVISTTADNYNGWVLETESGGGSSDTITSGETLTIQGGTNITVTNVGNVVTIRNDNTADITGVSAGNGLVGGGTSGTVSLSVAGGSGIIANTNDIAIDYDGLAGDMLPTTDSTYDLGSSSKRWQQGWFDRLYTPILHSGSTTNGTTSASLEIEAQNINNTNINSGDKTAGSVTVHGGNSTAFNSDRDIPGEPGTGLGGIGGDLNLYGGSGNWLHGDVNIGTSQTRYIYLDNNRWPTTTGSSGQVLTVGSSGVLSWQTPTVGDITSVTAGTGLSGGGTSGNVSLALDLSELSTSTTALDGTIDDMIVGFGGSTYNRMLLADVDLSEFNNNLGWTSNTGDITSVTAGNGLAGGGTSGAVTLSVSTGRGLNFDTGNLRTSFSSIVTNVTVGNGLNAAYTDTNDLTGLGVTTVTGIAVDLTDANVFTSTGVADRAVITDSNGSFQANVITLEKLTTERIEPSGNITQIEGQGGAGNIVIGLATGGSGYSSHTTFRGASIAGFGVGAHNVESSGFFRANASYSDSIVPGNPAHMDLRNNGLYSATGDYLRLNTATGNAWTFTGTVRANTGLRGNADLDTVNIDTLTINNAITFPTSDGNTNQVITTDGSGNLTFQDVTAIGGTITGVNGGNGLTGYGTTGTVTLNVGAGSGISVAADSISVSGIGTSHFAAGSILTSGETFADSDTQVMTAAAIDDRIQAYGYTTNTGDITSVTAGTGLSGGGISGTVELDLNDTGRGIQLSGTGNLQTSFSGIVTSVTVGDGLTAAYTDTNDLTGLNVSTVTGIAVDLTDTNVFTSTNTASRAVVRDGSGNFAAGVITATATSARYADLAEKYESDVEYEAGTVVVFGGDKEITTTNQENDHRVAGIISTDPAYMMNSEAEGQYVALRGRVPCKVIGPVKKGDVLVTSDRPGFAQASDQPHFVSASCIVGKALQDYDAPSECVIEVVV